MADDHIDEICLNSLNQIKMYKSNFKRTMKNTRQRPAAKKRSENLSMIKRNINNSRTIKKKEKEVNLPGWNQPIFDGILKSEVVKI